MPTIPETLINYEVYVDSTRYLGHADVELPEIIDLRSIPKVR